MITITREQFKKDEVWNKLFQIIKSNHSVDQRTQANLIPKSHIKDICEQARYFAVVDKFFISYDVDIWIQKVGSGYNFPTKITEIQVYDDQLEYELHRSKAWTKSN